MGITSSRIEDMAHSAAIPATATKIILKSTLIATSGIRAASAANAAQGIHRFAEPFAIFYAAAALRSILYISPFAFQASGADESLLAIIPQLSRAGCKIHVAAPRGSPYLPRYAAAGARALGLPILRLKRSRDPFYWAAYLAWFPLEVLLFAALILARRIDLVHVNMESSLAPAVAARLTGRPCVVHYRGKTVDTPAWFFAAFLPAVAALADRVIAISRASAAGFTRRGLTRKLTVLHNPVDLARYAAAADKGLFDRIAADRIVLFVGRLDPQKRVDDLIDAGARLRERRSDFALVIVGGDPAIGEERTEGARLRARAAGRDWIVFHGMERDVPAALAAADVLVLPSVNEGFGRVVIEAMAAGVPVVAARSGALPEILDDGALGALAEPGDPAGLAAAIDEALRGGTDVARRTEAAARAAHARFSIEGYVERLARIYDELT